jgi:hypothetical protein
MSSWLRQPNERDRREPRQERRPARARHGRMAGHTLMAANPYGASDNSRPKRTIPNRLLALLVRTRIRIGFLTKGRKRQRHAGASGMTVRSDARQPEERIGKAIPWVAYATTSTDRFRRHHHLDISIERLRHPPTCTSSQRSKHTPYNRVEAANQHKFEMRICTVGAAFLLVA